MTSQEYLEAVLTDQALKKDSEELKILREHRKNVEVLLKEHFRDSDPIIRYAGSKAKGTMNRETYDLDIICYFRHDDDKAGETLKEIYENVQEALEGEYNVEPKTSVIRLRDAQNYATDFHVDVVPGRFTDDSETDAYLYLASGEKCRLKTNLGVHLDHVKSSKVIPAIRLMKLWKHRYALSVRNFVLELSVIKLLEGKSGLILPSQLTHVLTCFKDSIDSLSIEDPANPQGNDLSAIFDENIKAELQRAAERTLDLIEESDWEAVFGEVDQDKSEKVAALKEAVGAATVVTRPWCE